MCDGKREKVGVDNVDKDDKDKAAVFESLVEDDSEIIAELRLPVPVWLSGNSVNTEEDMDVGIEVAIGVNANVDDDDADDDLRTGDKAEVGIKG